MFTDIYHQTANMIQLFVSIKGNFLVCFFYESVVTKRSSPEST